MNITKYGISAALIAAIGYFAGYMGIIPAVLIFGFTVYSDVDVEAKKNVTQAVVVAAFFLFIGIILSACSNGYTGLIDFISEKVSENVSIYKYDSAMKTINVFYNLNVFKGLNKLFDFVEFGVMIYAIISSLKGNVVKFPVISKMVNKHFGKTA